MGERAGNAPLASVVAVINDFIPEIALNIRESSLFKVSQLVATLTGFRIPVNKPIVGENVFTQTAGIHADGDQKKNLYFNDLLPERFGRKRKYALGKTSGKANIQKNLQELGLTLTQDELKKVTQRIIELGDKKEQVTAEDLPFIISDVLGNQVPDKVKIQSYVLTHSKGLRPTTSVSVEINGKKFEENAPGDGQYDAFWNALKKIYTHQKQDLPDLVDYAVRIPPGSNSDALCETSITWKGNGREFTTRGLDSDQTVSAIKATEKMLNLIQK
jgi:D-citramalate synthase